MKTKTAKTAKNAVAAETVVATETVVVETPTETPVVETPVVEKVKAKTHDEAWALKMTQRQFGPTGCVWITTHNAKTGEAYKHPRYRTGFVAGEGENDRYVENGKRMKGVGSSWQEAVESCRHLSNTSHLKGWKPELPGAKETAEAEKVA